MSPVIDSYNKMIDDYERKSETYNRDLAAFQELEGQQAIGLEDKKAAIQAQYAELTDLYKQIQALRGVLEKQREAVA